MASTPTGQLGCARCGALLSGSGTPTHTLGVDVTADHGLDLGGVGGQKPPQQVPPMALDDWEFDHDLRELKGLVNAVKAAQTDPHQITPLPLAATMPGKSGSPAIRTTGKRKKIKLRSPILAWTVISLGLIVLATGASLLGLAAFLQRQDLWTLGVPIAVAGQVGLLLGLALQLERVWQGSRSTVDRLEEVDERLCDLKQATNMLGVTHGSAGQAFYAHMAEGASPQLLMADLKGQLDLLAVRMSQRG